MTKLSINFAFIAAIALAPIAAPVAAQDINYGNDTAEWANDGECDDRRFFGAAMADQISWEFVGMDATDCRTAFENGTVQLWDMNASRAATQCKTINFGNDTGEYPVDGECDDRRFEGPAVARVLNPENVSGDATDCSRLCAFGVVSLREY